MFVAIPTAIPELPFIRSVGILVGRIVGSFLFSSKLGAKSTVFFSIFSSIVLESLLILASV